MKKPTIKVVHNKSYGARNILSPEAMFWMKEHGYRGKFADATGALLVPRHHPVLVACVEELGERAGRDKGGVDLQIAEVEGERYYVIQYDMGEDVIGEKDFVSTRDKEDLFVDSFPADKVFFTADTHFGSKGLIHFCKRPFKDEKDMEEELIRRWNETVPEDGTVFHLGDFAHGPASHWCEILERLNGTVHLITGNHDTSSAKEKGLVNFGSVSAQRIIDVDGQRIYLNHYPFLCYAGAYDKVWQLFGHVHSGPNSSSGLDLPRLETLYPQQYDVGVDNNDYRPVSIAKVKEKIDAQVKASVAQVAESSSLLLSGTPIVFLDVDGTLALSPGSRKIDSKASRHLEKLLNESGAGLVITGGWAAFTVDALREGPLKTLSWSLIGATKLADSIMKTIADWLSSSGGKHPYVIFTTATAGDTRAVRVNPTTGLTQRDVNKALEILTQGY